MKNVNCSISNVNDKNGLKIIYTNVDQLPNKIDEITLFLDEHDIDVMAVCEVLPKSKKHCISSFVIEGYDCYSCFQGRGVCVFVKSKLNITIIELDEFECVFKPSVFIKIISTANKTCFTLGAIYRSPNCSSEESNDLNLQINKVAKQLFNSGEDFIIVGDFNYPEINWSNETCSEAASHLNAFKLLETVQVNNLVQLVDKPTHHRALQQATLIDLLLSNDSDLVSNIQFYPPFGMSHHEVISFNFALNVVPVKKSSVFKYQVNKGNYPEFNSYLENVDWQTEREDVDDLWGTFHDTMQCGIDKFIPKKQIKSRTRKRPCPSTPGLLHKVRLKRIAYKIYKKCRSAKNYNTYCKYRNQVKWETRKSVRAKEKKIAEQIKNNPKLFFQYVSSKLKSRDQISNLVMSDGKLTETDAEKADVLKSFFPQCF